LNPNPANRITELLARWSGGDIAAREDLIPLVYEELRRLARHYLSRERQTHTLQSAALVHELYLRLVDESSVQLSDRLHFFSVAAELMRRVLVDHARKHSAAKRGGNHLTMTLEEDLISAKQREIDILALDDALNQLAQMDTQQSRIIELRFFGGLSIDQTARALGISPASVKRDWAVARAWLYRELSRTTDAR